MFLKSKKYLLIILALILVFALSACTSTPVEQESEVDPKVEDVENEIKSIDTATLKDKLDDDSWVIVDTRINDAYNGWKLDGVERGGHIAGAVDFSANWLRVEAKDKEAILDKALETKGIAPNKNIVLYDANGKDAVEVAEFLTNKGYENIYTYNVKEWAADDSLPMENYENYSMIVPAKWVNDLINGNSPEGYNGNEYKIFEISWGEESEDYNNGHIPGSVHVNTDDVEEGPMWNRLSDDRLEQFALNYGVTTDTTVVLYGADSTAAYRVAVILKYMGVEDIRVLNGGYAAWVGAGYETETTANSKEAVSSFGATVPVNRDYIIDLPEAKKILEDREGSILVDIRSWEEYIGETSGYSYIDGKGRPAGSIWGHDVGDYFNIDRTMKSDRDILAMWKEWNITPDKNLSFYCGTGWRAAEVLFYADVMGLENISLFDGGWNEWSNTPDLPIETGEPKN